VAFFKIVGEYEGSHVIFTVLFFVLMSFIFYFTTSLNNQMHQLFADFMTNK